MYNYNSIIIGVDVWDGQVRENKKCSRDDTINLTRNDDWKCG